MSKWNRKLVGCLVLAGVVSASLGVPLSGGEDKAPDKAAVERTRKTVRMLDDVYKTAVVLITEHYVTEESDLPAGTAAKALFAAIKEKGWHDVRLLDAAGAPINDENIPQDDFEKEAIKRLLKGEKYYDQVVERDGKSYLRAATPIPVVMKKCVMCHDNYAEVPEGQAIGALGYTIPIE